MTNSISTSRNFQREKAQEIFKFVEEKMAKEKQQAECDPQE